MNYLFLRTLLMAEKVSRGQGQSMHLEGKELRGRVSKEIKKSDLTAGQEMKNLRHFMQKISISIRGIIRRKIII